MESGLDLPEFLGEWDENWLSEDPGVLGGGMLSPLPLVGTPTSSANTCDSEMGPGAPGEGPHPHSYMEDAQDAQDPGGGTWCVAEVPSPALPGSPPGPPSGGTGSAAGSATSTCGAEGGPRQYSAGPSSTAPVTAAQLAAVLSLVAQPRYPGLPVLLPSGPVPGVHHPHAHPHPQAAALAAAAQQGKAPSGLQGQGSRGSQAPAYGAPGGPSGPPAHGDRPVVVVRGGKPNPLKRDLDTSDSDVGLHSDASDDSKRARGGGGGALVGGAMDPGFGAGLSRSEKNRMAAAASRAKQKQTLHDLSERCAQLQVHGVGCWGAWCWVLGVSDTRTRMHTHIPAPPVAGPRPRPPNTPVPRRPCAPLR
jgi:hypothetical protein